MTDYKFEGVANFRDFGGRPTRDGRAVRTGRLFRSGHHGEATEADLALFDQLGLELLVDLRRPPERERIPSRRPAAFDARVLEHAGVSAETLAPHLEVLTRPGVTPQDMADRMIAGYRTYPFDPAYVAVWRDYFHHLAKATGSALIHCHAGKDRTGVLCALTLHALGVPRDEIYADYLATNVQTDVEGRMEAIIEDFLKTQGIPVSEEVLRQVMLVDAAYLDAAIEVMVDRHGDLDTYLADVLEVTPEVREQLRARLLA